MPNFTASGMRDPSPGFASVGLARVARDTVRLMDLFTIKFIRNFTVEAIDRPLRGLLRELGAEAQIEYGGFSTARADVADGDTHDEPRLTVLALGVEQAGSAYGHCNWPLADICEDLYATVAAACRQWRKCS